MLESECEAWYKKKVEDWVDKTIREVTSSPEYHERLKKDLKMTEKERLAEEREDLYKQQDESDHRMRNIEKLLDNIEYHIEEFRKDIAKCR